MGIMLNSPIRTQAQGTADESLCNKHYEAAIKFKVDTPVLHYYTISKDATSGKEGRVIFSSGNLQYSPSYQHLVPDGKGGNRLETIPDFFRFAPRQIDRCTDGRDANLYVGNVWYDSFYLDTKTGTYTSQKCKSTSCNNAIWPTGPTVDYHGWLDLFTWGSSCKGKRANDTLAVHFKPYDQTKTNYGGPNTWRTGPTFYATASDNNPKGWRVNDPVEDVQGTLRPVRNNIDTNSKLNRFFDWGYANTIMEYRTCTQLDANNNPVHTIDSTCYRPGVWRTLTTNEWRYLMEQRKVENQVQAYACCCIYDTTILPTSATDPTPYISGILLYPDDWNTTMHDLPKMTRGTFGAGDWPRNQKLTYDQWLEFEKGGCAFLPSCYGRQEAAGGLEWTDCYFMCAYWSATALDVTNAYMWCYYSSGDGASGHPYNYASRRLSIAVRLVQDVN